MKQAFFVLGVQRGVITDNNQQWAHLHCLGEDQGSDQADKCGFMPSQQACDFKVIDQIRKIGLPAWVEVELEMRPVKKGMKVVISSIVGEVKRPTLTPDLKKAA